MKKTIKTAILAVLLLGVMTVTGQADMSHHQGDEAAMPSSEMREMMMQKMEKMQGIEMMDSKPCMVDGAPCPKPCMTGAAVPARRHGKSGAMFGMMATDHNMMGMKPGMYQRMEHELFLDRVDALDLTADQVDKLKAVLSACRKENIRRAADIKIARLELDDLMNEPGWSLKSAEPLIRQIQTLEGDMLVRHLQAIVEAREVLTVEQLQRAAAAEGQM